MALSKKTEFKRKFNSFKLHLFLISQPFIFSLAITIAWQKLHCFGWHFGRADETAITSAIIPTIGVAYGITAAWLLNAVCEKYRKMVRCVLEKDEHTFMLYRDERMPIVLHLFLATLSILLFASVALLDFKELWTGSISIFSMSFFLVFYWIVLVQLENPTKSYWLKERIPAEWLEKEIDEYFKL